MHNHLPTLFFCLAATFTVSAQATFDITPADSPTSCNGSITVTFGSFGPYDSNWTGPNGFSSTNEDIFNLCSGLV